MKLPDLSKSSKREKMMLGVGALVLFIMFSDRLVLGPWMTYSDSIDKEIVELEQTLKGQRQLVSRKPHVMSEVQAYEKFLNEGKSPEIEMAAFLKEIESIGRQSRISLQEISPRTSLDTEYALSYGLEVHYEGTLSEWIKFIYEIESSASLFVIEKAVVGLQDKDTAILSGYIHVRKPVLKEPLS